MTNVYLRLAHFLKLSYGEGKQNPSWEDDFTFPLFSYGPDNDFPCLNLPNIEEQLISHPQVSFPMNQMGP